MHRPHRTWREIKRLDSRDIVFMDNNVLACTHGLEQIADMIGQDIRVDFNQGLDARMITPEIAQILSQLKWIKYIRMSCDTDNMLVIVQDAIRQLGKVGVKPYRIFVYLLVQDIESAERRALALRDMGAEVFAQPYRDFITSREPPHELKRFARWVNRKEIFKTTNYFKDYRG